MKNILIVGGTGTLGKELIQLLIKKGKKISVLTRNPNRHSDLLDLGINLIEGDLADKKTLLTACKNKDAVIAAAHSIMGKGKYASEKIDDKAQKDLIDAACTEGVKHFTFVSVIGASPNHEVDFWRRKWAIEQYLQLSGLTFNIIRASAFMEFHIGEMMGKSILQKGKVTIFGKGENPTNFVSVKDVAQLIELCLDNSKRYNQIFEIGGLDNLTRKELVDLYNLALDKPVKVNHLSNKTLRFVSKMIKPFHSGMSRIMDLSERFDRLDQTFDARPILDDFPIKTTRVKDFITQSVSKKG